MRKKTLARKVADLEVRLAAVESRLALAGVPQWTYLNPAPFVTVPVPDVNVSPTWVSKVREAKQ